MIMKKILILLAIVIAVCYLGKCSCSGDSEKEHAIVEIEPETVTGADGTEYKTYQAACRAGDFEAAHEFVDKLQEMAEGKNPILYKEEIEKYQAAQDYVFKQEMMYLAADGSEEASNKIIFLLTELPVEGEMLSEGMHDFYKVYGNRYKSWVKRYNTKCDEILSLAIQNKNEYLAKKVLGMFKQNMEGETGGHNEKIVVKGKTITFDGNHGYVWYTNEDIDAAQKKYNQAVKSGAFK